MKDVSSERACVWVCVPQEEGEKEEWGAWKKRKEEEEEEVERLIMVEATPPSVALPWRAAWRHNGLNASYKRAGGRRRWLASSNARRRGLTRVVGGSEEEKEEKKKIPDNFLSFFPKHCDGHIGEFLIHFNASSDIYFVF